MPWAGPGACPAASFDSLVVPRSVAAPLPASRASQDTGRRSPEGGVAGGGAVSGATGRGKMVRGAVHGHGARVRWEDLSSSGRAGACPGGMVTPGGSCLSQDRSQIKISKK